MDSKLSNLGGLRKRNFKGVGHFNIKNDTFQEILMLNGTPV